MEARAGQDVSHVVPEELSHEARPVGRRAHRLRTWLYSYMLILVLLVLIAVFSALAPDTFATFGNLRTITSTQSVLIIVALGLTFPLAAGEFDLSFGAVLGLSSSLLAVLTVNQDWPLPFAILAVLALAVLIGLVNALFAVRLGINSLIVTLGMGTLLTGLTLAVSGNQVIAGAPHALTAAASTQLFGLPLPVYLGLLLALVAWYVYDHTPIGRYIYFTGEGREVARLGGLGVDRIRTGVFVTVAVMSSLAGIVNFGRLGSADPNIGTTFLLPAFATVFLGSAAIRPGRFNAWGTVVAVYLLVVGITGLQLLGGAGWLEQVFNGSALVLAVTFAELVRRSRRR